MPARANSVVVVADRLRVIAIDVDAESGRGRRTTRMGRGPVGREVRLLERRGRQAARPYNGSLRPPPEAGPLERYSRGHRMLKRARLVPLRCHYAPKR